MKVLVVNGNGQYSKMFLEQGHELAKSFEEADLVQFTGGHDVSPELYGELSHPTTCSSFIRDVEERRIYERCLEEGKLMSGICRGGQFLNVMNGGKMFQHVDGHAISNTHPLEDVDGRIIEVSSTHHQMMRPSSKGKIVAAAHSLTTFKEYMIESTIGHVVDPLDVEVVCYEDSNCLCFQPHPEFQGVEDCRSYYFECLEKYLGFK